MALENPNHTKRIIVDNATNSMDVRPGVNRLLERIDEILLTLPEDQTLFVGIGEDHSISFCQAFYVATINGAQQRSYRSGLSLEDSFDSLYQTVKKFKSKTKPSIKKALLQNDPNYEFALNLNIGCTDYYDAPFGQINTDIHVLKSGLPVNFHDLSVKRVPEMKGDNQTGTIEIIDQDDDATRAVVEKIAPPYLVGRQIRTNEGNLISADIRDEFSFNSLEDFAKKKKLRVVFIKAGLAHLFRPSNDLCKKIQDKSLNGIASRRGHTMLSLVPSLPVNIMSTFEGPIAASETDYIIQLKNSDITRFGDFWRTTKEEEFSHLKQIVAASGQAFTLHNLDKEIAKSKEVVSFGKFNKVIKDAQMKTRNAQRLASRATGPS